METEMAYTADVNRWRGPTEEPYHPHMLDTPWHPGWIAVTVLGFLIWWPIGLALLFFTLGSRKMGCWSHERWANKMERMQYKMERMRNRMERGGFPFGPGSSGSRRNFANSSIVSATPRTRKNSISSWRSIARGRPPRPTVSRRPERQG